MTKRNYKYLLVMVLFLLMPLNVFAKNAITLVTDKSTLEIGDELNVTAKINDDVDLYALTATLSYDKEVFEEIEDDNFTLDNETVDLIYNPANNKFGIISKTGEKPKNLFVVHLKVKENARVGDTEIKLFNVSSSDGKKKTTYNSSTNRVLVTRDAKEDEVVPLNKSTDVKEEKESILKTITSKPLVMGLIVLEFGILIALFYIMLKHHEAKTYLISLASIFVILLIPIISLSVINTGKQDTNKDGTNTLDDTKEIIKYLIDYDGSRKEEQEKNDNTTTTTKASSKKKTTKKKNNSYDIFDLDINNDGKVDVNDAGSSAEHVKEDVKYSITLSEKPKESMYIERGNVSLNIVADISPKEIIKEFYINDKYYKADYNTTYYTVNLTTPDKAGIFEFNITKVKLSNGREVKTKFTLKKEILKAKPYVDLFNIDDENNYFNFKLEDKDHAFIKGNVAIVDSEENEILNQPVKTENHLKYNFKKDELYKIIVKITYDLDTNLLNDETGKQNYYENEVVYSHPFLITSNYDFKISDVSITDAIEKGEKPVLSFASSNAKDINVEYIVIDGVEYDVDLTSPNHYQVSLEKLDTSNFGKYHITIDEVVLNNLKEFAINKDYECNKLTYNVLKNAPVISNITFKENKEEKALTVNYKVNDKDQTLENVKAVLTDSQNKILDTQEVQNIGKEVSLSYKNSLDGSYKVKFLANLNLGTERHIYTDKNIGEEEILLQKEVYIESAEVLTVYPTKGQTKYTIKFKIHVDGSARNTYNQVGAVTINGLNYDGNVGSDYTTTVSFTVPKEAGILELKVDRVKLRSEGYNTFKQEFISVPTYKTTIEVLKDPPSIANLNIIKEDYKKKTVTFAFDCLEDKGGFESGIVSLGEEKHSFMVGHNEIEFKEVLQDKAQDLIFKSTYDLDTNTLEGQDKNLNHYKDQEIHRVSYELYNPDTLKDIALTNLSIVSKLNNKYFTKEEKVNVYFSLENLNEELNLILDKIVLNDNEYKVTKQDNLYYVTLDGYKTAGEKELTITDLIFTNGKKISLTNKVKEKIEVLKEPVKIVDHNYTITEDNITLKFKLEDLDNSVSGVINDEVKIKIYDENNNELYTSSYQDEYTFKRSESHKRYYVKVLANYDLDIQKHGDNYYENTEIFTELISVDQNYIELSDISSITLLKEENDHSHEISEVNVDELKENKDNYFVRITMANMPTVYASIKDVVTEDKKMILVLDYKNVIKENSTNKQDIRIDFGSIDANNMVINTSNPESFSDFIERIKEDPSGTFTLTHDLDAANYTTETDTITDIDFRGTLDGKGYTIKNLNKQLFKNVNNATIKNLRLKDVSVGMGTKGIFGSTARGAKVENVFIDGYTKTSGRDDISGTLFGTAQSQTVIDRCSVTNLVFNNQSYLQNLSGGFVAKLLDSSIKNSYVIGTINSGWWGLGGLVGSADDKSSVENSYAKINIFDSGVDSGTTNSGFIGSTTGTVKNNLSLSTGKASGYAFASGTFKESINNYQLSESTLKPSTQEGVNSIGKDNINENFFQETMHFDPSIWNLKDASYENPPTLKAEFKTGLKVTTIENNHNYDANKTILYHNLRKLMPFYEGDKIIESGLHIATNDILNTSEITHIYPVDNTGSLVTYLLKDNERCIAKIKVIFKNGEKRDYPVTYDNTYDMVASYRINNINIDYTYNHYIIDSNSQLINNLVNYVSALSYEDNLDILTTTNDSRIYKEFYNEVTRKEFKEIILKYLSNTNYTITADNEVVSDYIEKEIKKDKKLEKLVYVYNYFRRFYDVNFEGIKLYDLILYNALGFDESATIDNIISNFLSDQNNILTASTNDTYKRVLGKYTDKTNITDLIEYLVNTLTDMDASTWFKKEFKGYLKEVSVEGRSDITYTAWSHLSNPDTNTNVNWYNYTLPIITLPERAAYILSTPTQYIIGAQRVYITNPFDEAQESDLISRIESYAERMKDYYKTASSILVDAKYFNDIHTIQIDKRFTYDENGLQIHQNPETTQEPFHKNFNEIINNWAYNDYNAATANGAYIIWRVEGLMDGRFENGYEYTFHTWSHETAHNMDARLFLKNNGRRYDAGGEDYADGNLTQSFGDGDIVMNLSRHFEAGTKVSANLDVSRIDSPDKIYDFYNKLFKTLYIMDYLEGKAFLNLTPEEQSKIAVQVSYPNEKVYTEDKDEYLKYKHTVYQTIDKSEYEKMHLDSIDDLYDNHLVIYPGVIYSTLTENRYGGENIYKVRWYQPHNDYGRPDSYSLKWLAYEMLGYKGYDAGYIEYYSNIHSTEKNGAKNYKTDLQALRTITNDDTMTFKKYKDSRFKEVEDNLKYIQHINVDEVYNKFYQALKADAAYIKQVEEEAKAKYPNEDKASTDARNKLISAAKNVKNSTEVRREVYYTIKDATNDFTSAVYDQNNPQEVTMTLKDTEDLSE